MTKITDNSPNFDYVKNFSKRMLKTHLFIGNFHEKRFVGPLSAYRDVVRVDANEDKFIENLVVVKRKIRELDSNSSHWIGITEPDMIGAPVGHNLWVELPVEIFGRYWFKVKTVQFLQNEVRLKLEIVRPLKSERVSSDESEMDRIEEFDLSTTINNISNKVREGLRDFYRDYVTYTNIKESLIFLTMLIGTVIAGGVNIIKYLMEYSLKLTRELSELVRVSTPIIISFINLLKAAIFGLYSIIIALVYGKPKAPAPVYNSFYSVDPNMVRFRDPRGRYNQYSNGRALPYPRATITPLD